jgi:hypothetical protein
VDGFKEDVFGFGNYALRDDKLDPVDTTLTREGAYVMARNAYLTSAGDLHRIEDFNYNQNQDRGPVNALALAYSGFPLVYPDIVGGTFGEGHFDLKVTPRMRAYMMRNAQWASLHSSMSMGQGPWTFGNSQLEKIMLEAARLHDRLQPYLYSQAIRFYLDGYPSTMTPLPVAFPDDPNVYGRENERVRGYEWMIGDALLATPLYGDDYETSTTRDVYLPRGTWMEYDSGRRYEGPQLLRNSPFRWRQRHCSRKTRKFSGWPGLPSQYACGDVLHLPRRGLAHYHSGCGVRLEKRVCRRFDRPHVPLIVGTSRARVHDLAW